MFIILIMVIVSLVYAYVEMIKLSAFNVCIFWTVSCMSKSCYKRLYGEKQNEAKVFWASYCVGVKE